MATKQDEDQFLRKTYVKKALKREGLRLSSEAADKFYEFLNKKVLEGIQELKARLPKFTKGPRKDQLKRTTIRLEDFKS
ncbi:MAG: hypothetical protein ACXQS8_06110 [Candidatus Helarchaeales archaeon]